LENINLKFSDSVIEIQKSLRGSLELKQAEVHKAALNVVSNLSHEGLGSYFIYLDNNLWSSVKNSKSYTIKESISNTYVSFLDESSASLDIDSILFVGPGDSEEIHIAQTYFKNLTSVSVMESSMPSLVDIYIDLYPFQNLFLYNCDVTHQPLIDTWNLKSKESSNLVVIKGGTTCNISKECLKTIFSYMDFKYMYFDSFMYTEDFNTSMYESDEVKVLSLYNYMRLFAAAGVDLKLLGIHSNSKDKISSDFINLHNSNFVFETKEDEAGVSIVCSYLIPDSIKCFFSFQDISLPDKIKLFHSYRKKREYIIHEIYSADEKISIAQEFSLSPTVSGFLISK
jgi:hypothetical protein